MVIVEALICSSETVRKVETLLGCASPCFVTGQAKECITKEKPVLDQKVYVRYSLCDLAETVPLSRRQMWPTFLCLASTRHLQPVNYSL